jgi:hypothetical protein
MSRLSTLDLLSAKLHTSLQPIDFTAITEVNPDGVHIEGLRAGMVSAMNRYPSTGSVVMGDMWVWQGPTDILEVQVADDNAAMSQIQKTINCRLDASQGMISQVLIRSKDSLRAWIATRCHHACMDGIGADLWLNHQLRVAAGEEKPVHNRHSIELLELKKAVSNSSKGPSAHAGRSKRVWCSGRQSGERGWLEFTLAKTSIEQAVSNIGGVTTNDLLGERLLATVSVWNQSHGWPSSKLSLWIPLDIRAQRPREFGNGASRVRIYRDSIQAENPHDSVKRFREDMVAAKSSGEWAVPSFKLPSTIAVGLTRLYIKRPWVDMGSIPFSNLPREHHIDSACVKQTNWTMVLHRWHPAGVIVSCDDQVVRFTLTYDTGALTREEAEELTNLYREHIEAAL